MAVTKIWKVVKRMDHVISYAKDENKIIRLTKNTPGVVTAGDIEKDADIEILNPDQVIATLVEGGSLNMEMTIGSGRGYVVADDNKKLLQNDKRSKKL